MLYQGLLIVKYYFVSLSQTFNFNKDEKNNSFPISYCLLDCV